MWRPCSRLQMQIGKLEIFQIPSPSHYSNFFCLLPMRVTNFCDVLVNVHLTSNPSNFTAPLRSRVILKFPALLTQDQKTLSLSTWRTIPFLPYHFGLCIPPDCEIMIIHRRSSSRRSTWCERSMLEFSYQLHSWCACVIQSLKSRTLDI
jgi:hypothetical protein